MPTPRPLVITTLLAVLWLGASPPVSGGDGAEPAAGPSAAAREAFERWRALDEEYRSLVKRLARLEEQARAKRAAVVGAFARCGAAVEEALARAPDDPFLHHAKAVLLVGREEFDAALPHAERAALAEPENVEFARIHLRALAGANRFADALAAVERILRRSPGDAQALRQRAVLLFFLNRFADAAAAFEAAEAVLSAGEPGAEERSAIREVYDFCRERLGEERKAWEREERLRREEAARADLPRVRLVTGEGAVVLELFEEHAPNTVANFISLASQGYYDGTRFHRVVPNFMVQGGDPLSRDADPENDGEGGPGYAIPDELGEGYRRHFRGSLSMANAGPDTAGSQFFVTHIPAPHLDGRHTVFGRVVEGQEVVDRLREGARLERVEILRKRPHPYVPERVQKGRSGR